jgi:hypothetical protein
VLLLESGTLKRAQILSQEQDSRVKLRKRGEERAQELKLGSVFHFL